MLKWINKQADKTLIFITGWGLDHTLLNYDHPNLNILSIQTEDPYDLNQLQTIISDHAKSTSISFLGFSMGAYIVQDLIFNTSFEGDKIILVGARPKYPENDIKTIKRFLNRQKEAYMTAFYRTCLRDDAEWRDHKHYFTSQHHDLDRLLNQLDYLAESSLKPIPNRVFIHGENDAIAPLSDLQDLNTPIHIIPECGHIPFFHPSWPMMINTILWDQAT